MKNKTIPHLVAAIKEKNKFINCFSIHDFVPSPQVVFVTWETVDKKAEPFLIYFHRLVHCLPIKDVKQTSDIRRVKITFILQFLTQQPIINYKEGLVVLSRYCGYDLCPLLDTPFSPNALCTALASDSTCYQKSSSFTVSLFKYIHKPTVALYNHHDRATMDWRAGWTGITTFFNKLMVISTGTIFPSLM